MKTNFPPYLANAAILLAPTVLVALFAVWDRDGIFLLPQTIVASLVAGALAYGVGARRSWGYFGLAAGLTSIVLSFLAFASMVG